MHAAIYARKSTEQAGVADEQKSVTRQIAHARAYATSKGWTVDEASIFVDDGISGAEFATRPGFVRLMNALKPRPPFQVLVMSEESRLGREAIETAYALKQLIQAGVRVFFYLENRERTLESPTDKIMLSLTAFADELEREKARQRTYDAMLRKAKAGHATGGAVYGYRNIEVRDAAGRRSHVERQVDAEQAAVIREIFTAYAAGAGVRTIAKRLNDAGRPSPRPQQGRPAGWVSSSVWAALRRPIYRGEIVWGQTKQRDQWGITANLPRDESDWIRVPAEALRIVPDDLWNAVQQRAHDTRAAYLHATNGAAWGRPTNATESKYLLTGFTRCAHCGASLVVRSRYHEQHRTFWYACSAFHHRGRAICANSLEVRIERADDAILSDVEQFVLDPRVVRQAIEYALDELRPANGRADADRQGFERELRAIKQEIGHLTRALAAGGDLPSLVTALQQADRRRRTLEAAIAAIHQEQPLTVRSERELKSQVLAKVAAWRTTLRQEATEARLVLRHLLTNRISLEATHQDGRRCYRYAGAFTIGGLFEGFLRPQSLASPRALAHLWTFEREGLITAA
jgi:site-specific DNA recombinase